MTLQVVIAHMLLGAACMPLMHTGLRMMLQALHLHRERGQNDAPV
jgi:hypothetical protein